MKRREHWLAASIFFLAGCMMYAAPAVVRGILYAARMTHPSWSYPDSLIEGMVPMYLRTPGVLAFLLALAAIVRPYFPKGLAGEPVGPDKKRNG